MRILVVDNYDSFVYNLVQYFGQLGIETDVWRNDDEALTAPGGVARAVKSYDGVVLSPGPGTPDRAGATMDLVRAAADAASPLLGVCLGHQAIGAVFGGTVDRSPELMHGKTSLVHHYGKGVLAGLPTPFTATRYHSLTVEPGDFPEELDIVGTTENGIIMALKHRELPIHGVQFHPESVLTEGGHRMLANWLAVAGAQIDPALVDRLERRMEQALVG